MAAVLTAARPLDARRVLLAAATLLAFGVVGLGAYVRLSDAGLGCPDWPGCYGQLVGVPDAAHDAARAWKEMIHRYLAGTLGLAIGALTVLAWRQRVRPLATTLLAGVVVCQALLGMWTVTLLLKPVIVTAHLLGGMTTLALLVWLTLDAGAGVPPLPAGVRPLALAALLVVLLQIALGGWVSSNYAALACPDFPACRSGDWPAMDFGHAFSFRRELGQTADGAGLPFAALTAIHWSHRLWASVVLLAVGLLAGRLTRHPAWRRAAVGLATLLVLQVGLGIANVLLSLPLPLAVAHNLGAALLLAALVAVNFRRA